MATLSVTNVVVGGTLVSLAAASAGGDVFANNRNDTLVLMITNASGTDTTITITAQNACSHGSTHDVTKVIATGTTYLWGAFEAARFNVAAGTVAVTYSDEAGLTVGAFRITKPGTAANEA